MTSILDERTYTRRELAEKLHVTPTTIDNYIRSGKLKALKLGRKKTLITETAIKEYIEKYSK